LDIEEKVRLVVQPPTEEVVTEKELRELFETAERPTHYIGLEISGLLHLGSLVLTGYKLRDLNRAGVKTQVFLADWHSVINEKLGGDWDRIKEASSYYKEAFETFAPGTEFVLGSDLYHDNDQYWRDIISFSKHVSLNRATRTLAIMGRSMKDALDVASYIYPSMQGVDIHHLKADIAHAGMDQRKVHMLAREVYPKMGWKPPIALHHHLLLGLERPEKTGMDEDESVDMAISGKMSKSKPWTCIFVHDDEATIRNKLVKAWCPEGMAQFNPILEIVKYLVFHEYRDFSIDRPAKYGGPVTFSSYVDLERAYIKREIHPADLKASTATYVDKIVDGVRKRFEGRKTKLEELMGERAA
jgi:tyrosyl-tRNA synthetase